MVWLIRRIALSILMLWLVVTVIFLSLYIMPGDPVMLLLGADGFAPDPAAVAALRAELGLDQPIYVQYLRKLWSLLHFDLGISIVGDTPVIQDIARRLPRTLELVGVGALLSLIIGIPAGVRAGLKRGGGFDRIASAVTGFAQAVPVFVIGTILVLVLAQNLRLVPAGGYVDFAVDPARHILLLLMPSTAIAVGLSAIVFRITRASVLDVMPQDYVRTARAKGVPTARINSHHILRNALMPVVTVFALHVGTLLSGTVLVEFVFNWPGLSGMLISGVISRDYTVVTGVLTVTSAIFILINLLVDIVYSVLDPRVRR